MIWVPTLMLVIVRAAGILLLAPVFSHSALPIRLRFFLAIVIALAVVGRFAQPAPVPASDVEFLLAAGLELLIGLTIGYAARMVFVGIEIGAFHVSQQMGISLSEVFDPFSPEATGPVRRMFQLLAIVIFLAIGGHRALIAALLGTFEALPPGLTATADADWTSGALKIAVSLTASSFLLAIKVAAPVLIALLLATAALGLLQRTMPQCNMLSTGIPVRAMLTLLVLSAALLAMGPIIRTAWSATAREIQALQGLLR